MPTEIKKLRNVWILGEKEYSTANLIVFIQKSKEDEFVLDGKKMTKQEALELLKVNPHGYADDGEEFVDFVNMGIF